MRTKRPAISKAMSARPPSATGRHTRMPALIASAAITASAIAPFSVGVSITRTLVRVSDGSRGPTGQFAVLALTSAPHGRAPLRAARDRAQVAGDLGARAHLGSLERCRRGAAVVRARDAAVSLGRAPHGASEELLGR